MPANRTIHDKYSEFHDILMNTRSAVEDLYSEMLSLRISQTAWKLLVTDWITSTHLSKVTAS